MTFALGGRDRDYQIDFENGSGLERQLRNRLCRRRRPPAIPPACSQERSKSCTRYWRDANFDGKVNGTNFAFLASNFNQGASQADIAALDSFAAVNGLMVDVPEPACTGTIAIMGLGILRQRRRYSILSYI